MSGLFRYNSSNAVSPKRRSTPLNPFCSSPIQSQDATLDHTNSSIGSFSGLAGGIAAAAAAASGGGGNMSGGNTSPGHRQSLRDYDEQLNALRRENFNLKLRIYFLESNSPGNLQTDGKEAALYKQNVDLKVETETLRAELKEKQNLICEAATALNLIEQSQKSNHSKHAARVEELQQKIAFLEQEVRRLEASHDNDVAGNDGGAALNAEAEAQQQQRIDELTELLRQQTAIAEDKDRQFEEVRQRAAEHEEQIRLADEQYGQLYVEFGQLKAALASNGNGSIENSAKQNQSVEEITQLRERLALRECDILDLQEALQKQTTQHENGCKALHMMTKHIKKLELELKTAQTSSASATLTNSIITSPATESNNTSAASSATIAALQNELATAQQAATEAHAWRQECSDVCSALTIRLKELAEFLDMLLRNKDVLGVLANDHRKAMRHAIDTSLNLSNSVLNMTVSGERFSLLGDSQFVDLLHTTQLTSTAIGADQSTIADLEADATANKENVLPHQLKRQQQQQQQLIDSLRNEVRALKSELQRSDSTAAAPLNDSALFVLGSNVSRTSQASQLKRESRTAKPNTSVNAGAGKSADHQSESDACWSEPDRKVSQARIGLEDAASLRNSNSFRSSPKKLDATGESSCSSGGCGSGGGGGAAGSSSKLQRMTEQLADMELKLVQRENVTLKQQCAIVEADNRLKEERLLAIEMRSELAQTSERAARAEERVAQLTGELTDSLNANRRLSSEAQAALECCQHLEADLLAKGHAHSAELEALRAEHSAEVAATSALRSQLNECHSMLDFMRENEQELQAQIVANELAVRSLRKSLDEAAIQSSVAVLERNRVLTDRRLAEEQRVEIQKERDEMVARVGELNKRIAQLEKLNAAMQNRLVATTAASNQVDRFQLCRSASSGTSFRYGHMMMMDAVGGSSSTVGIGGGGSSSDEHKPRLENSSPDLGIESDACRTSGSDGGRQHLQRLQQQQQQRRANVSAPSTLLMAAAEEAELEVGTKIGVKTDIVKSEIVSDPAQPAESVSSATPPPHDCAQIDGEVIDLKRKLTKAHQAYRQILQQLRTSNSRKEQVERDIRREICKTQSVLQMVRTNIEGAGGPSSASPLAKRNTLSPSSAAHHREFDQ